MIKQILALKVRTFKLFLNHDKLGSL